jgi:hypothetical protein
MCDMMEKGRYPFPGMLGKNPQSSELKSVDRGAFRNPVARIPFRLTWYRRNTALLQPFPDEGNHLFLSDSSSLGPPESIPKVVAMKVQRVPYALAAVLMICGACLIVPMRARANDFVMPFGGLASAPSVSLGFAATATASGASCWTTPHGTGAQPSPLSLHENHIGLGGNIVWDPNNMHDDHGSWRHHDDDEDDGHVSNTQVPEPSSALLVFSGISALAGWRVRQRAKESDLPDLA